MFHSCISRYGSTTARVDHQPAEMTVVDRVVDVAALRTWVEELQQEYRRRSGRALRCRNSLTHGGPFSAEAMASVQEFVWWQAGLATTTALRGVLAGHSVPAALKSKRDELVVWRDRMETAKDVFDALVQAANSGPSPTGGSTE